MKTYLPILLTALACLFVLHPRLSAAPVGTPFTYQGHLNDSGGPANGYYDFFFALYDSSAADTGQIGSWVPYANLPVTNGLFTVSVDFGNVFTGAAAWLQVTVRSNGAGTYTSLAPRQPLTATPYALMATSASNLLGTVVLAQIPTAVLTNNQSGVTLKGLTTVSNLWVTGTNFVNYLVVTNPPALNGSAITNLSASQLASGTVPDGQIALNVARTNQVWLLSGNAGANPTNGAYLGTRDNLPLEIQVNGTRALRLEPNATSPNVIGGYSGNMVSNGCYGATIGGGGSSYSGPNRVGNDGATVVGGVGNTASGFASTAMGNATASGDYSTAMGSFCATTNAYTMAAGRFAKAIHRGAFVWADSQYADFASTANDQFLIRAQGGVGINKNNPNTALDVNGQIRLNNNDLLLRDNTDSNHGLGWYSWDTTKQFAGAAIDGPVLYGCAGGALGTLCGPQKIALFWNSSGNVGIGTASPTNKLHVLGGATFSSGNAGANQNVVWAPGNASWSFTSDRNAKEQLVPVNQRDVLDKLCALPITEWNYIGYDQRHIGPMAQDFHAAFPLNPSDTSLNDADLHGVALAAIQGLNEKVESGKQKAEIRMERLETENAELKHRLARLEQLLNAKNGGAQ